jgi:hypothetical protein
MMINKTLNLEETKENQDITANFLILDSQPGTAVMQLLLTFYFQKL